MHTEGDHVAALQRQRCAVHIYLHAVSLTQVYACSQPSSFSGVTPEPRVGATAQNSPYPQRNCPLN